MKKISMKLISGLISMIMMINLIMPMGLYASVETGEETVIEETVIEEAVGEETIDEETVTEENLEEQMTTASSVETVEDDEKETKEEDDLSETASKDTDTDKEEISESFSESKTIGDVTISVNAEAGAFPAGSYLEIQEIASDTDLSSDDETLAVSYSYDITIYDKDDNEIEPAEGKNVSVSFSMDKIADSNLDTNIYHTSDDGTVTELDITTNGDTATVATDSFSLYTVEFTYGELTYEINGGRTTKLSDILSSVGLTGEVSNVECSDTSLFSASHETGEWIISSHMAFTTTEWMKVTIDDVVYEIKVTDSNNIVASGICNGTNITWTLDDEGTFTLGGTGAMIDYRDVPPWQDQKSNIIALNIADGITHIGEYAFKDCINLRNVEIPASVTSIGELAFSNCSSLSSVVIPAGVTSIGFEAFGGCRSLRSIIIPASVTGIREEAFMNIASDAVFYYNGSLSFQGSQRYMLCLRNGTCGSTSQDNITWSIYDDGSLIIYGTGDMADYDTGSNIAPWRDEEAFGRLSFNVIILDGVTSIGERAFDGFTNLSSITIPASVTSIEDGAFTGCTGLSSVTIKNGVTSIGETAFAGCTDLSSINIPGSVTNIGDSAFEGCSGLSSITIQGGITSIGEDAFSSCSNLSSVTVPGSITSMDGAFRYCTGLSNVTIQYGVTSIGENAFYGCTNLSSITIPESVTSIEDRAFYNCTNLSSITIPGTVTNIGAYAFEGCGSLSRITIPGTVTNIGIYAFEGCNVLSDITIQNGVQHIGNNAFAGCANLPGITIPGSVTNIGVSAFEDCSGLCDVTIQYGVTSIGSNAFKGCAHLDRITIPVSVTNIGAGVFDNIKSDAKIYYEGTLAEFNNVSGKDNIPPANLICKLSNGNCGSSGSDITWRLFDNGLLEINGTGTMAFYSTGNDAPWNAQKDNITTVTISDGVTNIGGYAFEGCTNLSSIVISDSVTVIDSHAFGSCSGLSSITIPNSVTNIGNSAFEDCSSLSSITIPNSVTNIDISAFEGCSSLSSITISNSVTNIGNSAFEDCSSLSSITIPNSVESIGQSVFEGCSSLSSITIPASVSSIEVGAFQDMGSNATNPTIYYGATKEKWYEYHVAGSIEDYITVIYTPIDITITAKDQNETAAANLANDISNIEITGSLATGHTLEGITLTVDIANRTIIPSDAVIKSGTATVDLEGNYSITYVNGTLIDNKANQSVAVPTSVTNDDSVNKNDYKEDSSTFSETGYEVFMNELRAAAKKGTAQTLVLNWGNSLSYEAIQILKDNPQLTLIFNYKWRGVDYSTTIGGGRTVHVNKTIPWYGPECLTGLYGASMGRTYANRTGNAVTGTTNTQCNGVYVVQGGDNLWKIANYKLHVSVDYLVWKNKIVNRNRIRAGQILKY